ncbi:hypothetical protein LBMAG42_16120 [Deltaproteobacteria bacterium]|nr:hypothetical protein LBMAG42_16120 [Deltaproteobacteria bacterium]
MVVEAITEIDDGSAAGQSDLQDWADEFGLTMPVVADPESALMWKYAAGFDGSVGLPFTVVIDRGVVIDSINSGTQVDKAVGLL